MPTLTHMYTIVWFHKRLYNSRQCSNIIGNSFCMNAKINLKGVVFENLKQLCKTFESIKAVYRFHEALRFGVSISCLISCRSTVYSRLLQSFIFQKICKSNSIIWAMSFSLNKYMKFNFTFKREPIFSLLLRSRDRLFDFYYGFFRSLFFRTSKIY